MIETRCNITKDFATMDKKEQKISPIKQRILYFADTLGISKREFYTKIGVSRGTLESNTGITEDILAKFIAIYPEIDLYWLILGEGTMYRDTAVHNDIESPDRDEVVMLLREKVADQQRIIDLLDEKLEAVMSGGNTGTEIEAAAG
jgi:hypothetical protein